MNLVGKILVWVILVMSLVFMAFTITVYATQHNWKVKSDALDSQLKDAQTKNNSLKKEKDELLKLHAQYIADRQQEIAKLSAENEQYKESLTQLQEDADRLNKDTAVMVTTLEAVHANLKKDRDEIESLRTALDQSRTERTNFKEETTKATDLAQTYALNYATLMATNRQLAKDLADAREVLNILGESPNPERHTGIPPANIVGQITEVRASGMVEISLGSDSGLERGHRLHVYHNDTYLGQIEITMTQPDRAAAKILPEFRTGTIQRGDHVASKITAR